MTSLDSLYLNLFKKFVRETELLINFTSGISKSEKEMELYKFR